MKNLVIAGAIALAAVSAQAKNIVDTAVAARNFKPFDTVLQAAGLVDTSKDNGLSTVLAPTDEVFAKVQKVSVDALLKDKAKLTTVPAHHVVAGKILAKDIKHGEVKTVQGSELTLAASFSRSCVPIRVAAG